MMLYILISATIFETPCQMKETLKNVEFFIRLPLPLSLSLLGPWLVLTNFFFQPRWSSVLYALLLPTTTTAAQKASLNLDPPIPPTLLTTCLRQNLARGCKGETSQPPTVVCKMESQLKYIRTHCIHVFARLTPICTYAQLVIINNISTSELSRKFIKSALLVGVADVFFFS